MSSKLYLKRPTGVMDSGFGLLFCPQICAPVFISEIPGYCFNVTVHSGVIYVFSYIFGTKMKPILKSLKCLFFLAKVEENDPLPISIYGPTKTFSDEFMVSH